MRAPYWIALLLCGFCFAGSRITAPPRYWNEIAPSPPALLAPAQQRRVTRPQLVDLPDKLLAPTPATDRLPAFPVTPAFLAALLVRTPGARFWHSGTDPPTVRC